MSILDKLFGGLRRKDARRPEIAAGEAGTLSAESLCAQAARLHRDGLHAQSIGAYAAALELDPRCGSAHAGLGALYRSSGEPKRAAEHFCRAAELDPSSRDRGLMMVQALREAERIGEALERAQSLQAGFPRDPDVGLLRAHALRDLGRYDEAVDALERLVAEHPHHVPALEFLAGLYHDCGLLEQSIAMFRRDAALRPDSPQPAGALLLHKQYRRHDRDALFRSHLEWGARFGQPAVGLHPGFCNDPDPERPLSLGYVSADFFSSSAAFFIEPLLEHHDPERFRVTCYHTLNRRDGLTARLRSRVEQWRDVDRLSDSQLCAQLREDRIDVLVELNGHTRGNRLTALAHKPAPVQVTYLGYGATTGLAAIDYRITDRWIDPPGVSERYYVERLAWLPHSMWCFTPFPAAPAVAPLPAASNGYVTFASLNNFSKVSDEVLEVWAALLASIPGSRLLLVGVPTGVTQRRVLAVFARRGVEPSRLVFFGRVPLEVYLRLHHSIDIALDPFPYTGGATTCNALWMGVPVLTLVGESVLARSGLSILSALGLDAWIAHSPEQYLRFARELAADHGMLARLRAGLRERLMRSPIGDGQQYARDIEHAYRGMWRAWCARVEHPDADPRGLPGM